MSDYIHFFVRNKKNPDNFIPIAVYSRSNEIYHIFQYFAPYEHITQLDKLTIKDKLNSVRVSINECEEEIRHIDSKATFIQGCNNKLDDKMEQIFLLEQSIREHEEILDEKRYTENFLLFLYNIIDEICFDDTKDIPELFVGIECGYNVTTESIYEEFV